MLEIGIFWRVVVGCEKELLVQVRRCLVVFLLVALNRDKELYQHILTSCRHCKKLIAYNLGFQQLQLSTVPLVLFDGVDCLKRVVEATLFIDSVGSL